MQTGTEERGRQIVLDALAAEGALKEITDPAHGGEGGEAFIRHKSALAGMRMALPLALWLWALIAALIWVWRR